MWEKLTENQKQECKNYCNFKFGKTFVYCETGEPMYMKEDGSMLNINLIIDLLFNINEN